MRRLIYLIVYTFKVVCTRMCRQGGNIMIDKLKHKDSVVLKKNSSKKKKIPILVEKTAQHHFRLSESLKKSIKEKGIASEDFRFFVHDYGKIDEEDQQIMSGDWKKLKALLGWNPSLQLIGNINSGKSHLTSELIKNDKDHVYIVLDSHNDFPFLDSTNQISDDITESCRLILPESLAPAVATFSLYQSILTSKKWPNNYIVIVEEALRFKESGIKNLLAECRKFVKVLAISQALLVDFCPMVKVRPYHQFRYK
jgi:hypothetical protein